MLNAELKSMNGILTYESFFVRGEWKAVAMATLVERLDQYANWNGSKSSQVKSPLFI